MSRTDDPSIYLDLIIYLDMNQLKNLHIEGMSLAAKENIIYGMWWCFIFKEWMFRGGSLIENVCH